MNNQMYGMIAATLETLADIKKNERRSVANIKSSCPSLCQWCHTDLPEVTRADFRQVHGSMAPSLSNLVLSTTSALASLAAPPHD